MKIDLSSILRTGVTLLAVGLALAAGWMMWRHYEVDPWTRDGKVRADIVRVAPDVPGLVTRVLVHENDPVREGQALFVVDAPRYALALAQARAAVASAQAALVLAREEYRRNLSLGDLVSAELTEQSRARVALPKPLWPPHVRGRTLPR